MGRSLPSTSIPTLNRLDEGSLVEGTPLWPSAAGLIRKPAEAAALSVAISVEETPTFAEQPTSRFSRLKVRSAPNEISCGIQ